MKGALKVFVLLALVAVCCGYTYTYYNNEGFILVAEVPDGCASEEDISTEWHNVTLQCQQKLISDDCLVLVHPMIIYPYVRVFDCCGDQIFRKVSKCSYNYPIWIDEPVGI